MILQDTIPVKVCTVIMVNKLSRKYNIICQVGDIVDLPWRDIRKTKHRRDKILLSCDECEREFYRQIRDVCDDFNICKSCAKTGHRNPAFGKPANINSIIACKKWMEIHGNPFAWPEIAQDLKNRWKETHPIHPNRGKPHSDATKQKISEIALHQFKIGTRTVSSGWGRIKIRQYEGIDYQSTYELKFLKYIHNLNLLHIIDRGPKIQYEIDGVEHSYFSDYQIRNTNIVIEIKSDYIWKKHLEVNIKKKECAEKLYDYIIIMNNDFTEITNKLKKEVI